MILFNYLASYKKMKAYLYDISSAFRPTRIQANLFHLTDEYSVQSGIHSGLSIRFRPLKYMIQQPIW